MSQKQTAYHEAGHAAADLILGHGSIGVTIAPKGNSLGGATQLYGDDMTVEGMEDLVVALYAGAEAEKRITPDYDHANAGAWEDDEKAADYLRLLNRTEHERRERTADLISEHWGLVELIASQLLHHESLQGDEVYILLDVYRGESTMEELEEFRVHFLRRT